MTELRFQAATELALSEVRDTHNVGSLGEKPIHRTLKYFVDTDVSHHEVKMLGSVCDVANNDGIFEIQTRAFDRLVPKLEKFLPSSRVTLIYPIIKEKQLTWLDPETGEVVSARKVSKKGKVSDALPELSKIKGFIGNENLTFRIYLLAADEYRYLDGRGADKKHRATKYTVIPTKLFEELEFNSADDLKKLIPDKLPKQFTAKDFYSSIGMKGRRAYFSLSLCIAMGFVKKIGMSGRAYLYEKT